MKVGERLKTWRNSKHLSGAKLGAALGVGQSAVANWESDRSAPAPDKLALLSEMGLNLNWLLTGKGPMLIADLGQAPDSATQDDRLAELAQRVAALERQNAVAQAVLMPPSGARRGR